MRTLEELENEFEKLSSGYDHYIGEDLEFMYEYEDYHFTIDGNYSLAELKRIVALADEYKAIKNGG